MTINKNSTELRTAYLSLFSGIGGLEHPSIPPVLFCEQDEACHAVIRSRDLNKTASIHRDIKELIDPPPASFVVGGWPCQDISSAGKQLGLSGNRSKLFFDMLRVAVKSGAHTIIGENVPNLLTINGGADFEAVKLALREYGFHYISWRTLNAREFKLPQDRNRLFIVASKQSDQALALHCEVPRHNTDRQTLDVHGFYWTGGKRSIDTPIGPYNPDWAFVTEREEKLYFVRETKSTLDSEERRTKENQKIACGRRHFETLGIDFDVVTALSEVSM